MEENRSKHREYRDIAERYCRFVDENVVVIRNIDAEAEEYECLSAHLCGDSPACRQKDQGINHEDGDSPQSAT